MITKLVIRETKNYVSFSLEEKIILGILSALQTVFFIVCLAGI
jgi:hypothetical protein